MGELRRAAHHESPQNFLSRSLLRCPRCDQFTLERRVRDGVEIDVCTRCAGVWLDQSELEQLHLHAQGDPQASLQNSAADTIRARVMRGRELDDN